MALDHNFPRSLYPTGDRRYHSLGGYVCSLLQFGKNGWIAGQRCSAYARELARVLARHPRPLNASESELSAVGQRPDLTAAIVNAVGSIQPARTRACRMMVSHCSRDTAVSPRIPGCIVTSSPRRSVHPTRSSVVQAVLGISRKVCALDGKRCSRHLRIGWKGGERLPQRRALVGSGETFN